MIILSKKSNLIVAIVAIIFALVMFACAFCLVYFNLPKTPTDRTFTFKKYEERPAYKTRFFEIYVLEEEMPLSIPTIANGYVDEEALQNIKSGDTLLCKTTDGNKTYCYEIVELIANGNVILSLEDAQRESKNNSIAGAVVTSTVGVIMLAMSGILFHRAKYGYSEKYKNAQKETLTRILMENTELSKMSAEERQRIIDSVDLSDELPCEKEELLSKFTNSFYSKGNRDYTTAMQYLENIGCYNVFIEALKTILTDGELRVCYDGGTVDNSALFVLYKINKKIIAAYILKNDETGRFDIDRLDLTGNSYKIVKLTKSEKAEFVEKLREYNRLREDIFVIDSSLLQ